MACVICHGFPGVVCDLCGDRYCPFCWLNNCYDNYPCVSLCDACYHNLKQEKKASRGIFLVRISGEPYPRVVHSGRSLLKFFRRSSHKTVEKIQVPNTKTGLHMSI